MVWAALAATALTAAGEASKGGQAATAPAASSADGNTVNVGGLNVPAFPDFPSNMFNNDVTRQSMMTGEGNYLNFYIAGGLVLAALLYKKFK